jgi:hypothetical protein
VPPRAQAAPKLDATGGIVNMPWRYRGLRRLDDALGVPACHNVR